MIAAAQLQTLSALINQTLALDHLACKRLSQLAGKRLRLQCTEPALDVIISVDNIGQIALLPADDQPVNTRLSGSLSAFMQLLASDDKASAMINSGLHLKGNSQLLLELGDILQQTDLDWEYHLSRMIGDLPAHLLGKISRHGQQWLGNSRPVFARHLQEFVREEARLTPHRDEIDQFITDVQQLALRTERLQARLQRLQQGKTV